MRAVVRSGAVLSVLFTLAGCGGGGGGSPAPEAAFVTADPRGMTSGGMLADGAFAPTPPGGEATGAGADLAREIAEADVYRVEGDTLYLANVHTGLTIVDLAGGCVVGRLALDGYPHELFLRGQRALLFLSRPDGTSDLADVSVADPASPTLTERIPLTGAYRTSRLVGDVLYVVAGNQVRSFALDPDLAPVDAVALPDEPAFVHATDTTLVVAGWSYDGTTPLALVDVSDPAGAMALRGGLPLPGWMSDEFKMDLRGDVLRAVVHDGEDGGLSRLFTIDVSDLDAPAVMASLGLARGEQLFATRFDGTAAYVVTFEQVDPLWVVDLSDPWAPAIAGSLIVPGWSTHLVPTGDGRLVAIGVEVDEGWNVVASLFDVQNPAAPTLLDRADLGPGSSTALYDAKALGVFPGDGLVVVPMASVTDRLAVLDLSASGLDLRGAVDLEGTVLRGFPHPRGLVGVSTEQVVVVDPATLADIQRCTIAENVVDVDRLDDGRVLPLVARRAGGRLGDVTLPMVPERLLRHGMRVAVLGWDDLGRAARIVDFSSEPPTVSERLALGGAWYVLGDPGWGMARPEVAGYGWGNGTDALLTDDGHLVVHGLPYDSSGGGGGMPGPKPLGFAPTPDDGAGILDGFVVIDVLTASLEPPVEVEDGFVTGFVAGPGAEILYTVGRPASDDALGRPRMLHVLHRVDLMTRLTAEPVNVPGALVAAQGPLVFTVEDRWTDGWDWECAVLAVSIDALGATVLDRRVLPEGAWDLRAAGATLCFVTSAVHDDDVVLPGPFPGGDDAIGMGAMPGLWWSPTTTVHVLRLGTTLEAGPSIPDDGTLRALLLVEDGAALTTRDGLTVERWDLSGLSASRDWEAAVAAVPWRATADTLLGGYLVALGYAGHAHLP